MILVKYEVFEMNTSSTGYLTLKRAAQQLGVHEQTLRSWERRGLIQMERLPQSGYRRVPQDEVHRLQKKMLNRNTPAGVRIDSPARDVESVTSASRLAEVVRAELASLGDTTDFEEFMQTRRGRQWSS